MENNRQKDLLIIEAKTVFSLFEGGESEKIRVFQEILRVRAAISSRVLVYFQVQKEQDWFLGNYDFWDMLFKPKAEGDTSKHELFDQVTPLNRASAPFCGPLLSPLALHPLVKTLVDDLLAMELRTIDAESLQLLYKGRSGRESVAVLLNNLLKDLECVSARISMVLQIGSPH